MLTQVWLGYFYLFLNTSELTGRICCQRCCCATRDASVAPETLLLYKLSLGSPIPPIWPTKDAHSTHKRTLIIVLQVKPNIYSISGLKFLISSQGFVFIVLQLCKHIGLQGSHKHLNSMYLLPSLLLLL